MIVVNEAKIRLTAFWVLLLAISFLLSHQPWIVAALTADFALRSFNRAKWSPLFLLSSIIANVLNWNGKPVFLPAKRFAARIGFMLSLLILLFALLGSLAAVILGGVLALFAALESLVGFCAGCYVYDWINHLTRRTT
jgi:hypothetical protein